MLKIKIGKWLIALISLAAIITIFFIEPIKQDLAYHQFIDNRTLLGIPNFWDVVSNLPFFIVGMLALYQFNSLNIIAELRKAYWLFFFGVAMVAFGSGYYHYSPSNETLLWDRLPMTIAFMSLFALIISEFIDIKIGAILLIPLLILGVLSVLYWQWTESNGVGDLRFYALVQFLPIVMIPIIIVLFPSKYDKVTGYWLLFLGYVTAKLFEYFDEDIFALTSGIMSGHALKHVAAAIGVAFLYLAFKNRVRNNLSHY